MKIQFTGNYAAQPHASLREPGVEAWRTKFEIHVTDDDGNDYWEIFVRGHKTETDAKAANSVISELVGMGPVELKAGEWFKLKEKDKFNNLIL